MYASSIFCKNLKPVHLMPSLFPPESALIKFLYFNACQFLEILYDSAVVILHMSMDLQCLQNLIQLCSVRNRYINRMCSIYNILDVFVVDAIGPPGLKLRSMIIGILASITALPASPPRIASYTFFGSAPAFAARTNASETTAIVLFTIT